MTQSLGVKIKGLREAANISIDDFAERASISNEQLSMIESGKSLPSMAILSKIVQVLGIRLGTLLDGMEQAGPVVSRGAHSHAVSFSNNDNAPREHLDFYSLAEGKSDRHMEPYIINISSEGDHQHKLSHHEGEEFVYIMDGEITMEYGNQTYKLSKGDSIYYDSIIPHHISSTSPSGAQILAVVYLPV